MVRTLPYRAELVRLTRTVIDLVVAAVAELAERLAVVENLYLLHTNGVAGGAGHHEPYLLGAY